MANMTVSRLGLVNATGTSYDALFLKVFSGEVLSAFRKATVFESLHTVRTISSGKSAQFPIIGLSSTAYHTPGTQLTGNAIKHAEATINIDDKLVSQVFVADIDEAKNHYDVRSQYSTEMGNALAYTFDKNVAATIAQAARTSTNFNTDLPGGTRIKIVAANKAAITGANLVAAMWSAAEQMDINNVPPDGRTLVLGPTEYYKLAQTTDVLNRDWGGSGAYADGTVLKVAGISIVKSNHLPTTNRSAVTGENNTYHANYTDSVGLVFNKQAVGTVKLMDLKMEQTGSDVHALWQGTFMVGSMAHGSGVLRPDCAVEIYTATT